ncbi:MAG: o-succinylbenzoate synthase [Prevotella sp.]|nr:o-succinylbenzoate synthase [Prevotella sp.]
MAAFSIDISTKTLQFLQPAGTSRGVYLTRKIYLITLTDNENPALVGVGECAPLPDLSVDAMPDTDYEQLLRNFCEAFQATGVIDYASMHNYPSMLFGLETALAQYRAGGNYNFFNTRFGNGEVGIPINGLVWMGTFDEMYQRIEEKINQGYRCIKLKIGAIDFQKELELIRFIRLNFTQKELEIRVDANGAFTPEEAMSRLDELAKYELHSIEQPIRSRQPTEMARLCLSSPLPIAFDEELIGVSHREQKIELLEKLHPHYIVVKPSLHGGMVGAEEWITLANERSIGSWITSALESNIGLHAIAQLTAKIYGDHFPMPQGLGTGQLFANNIPMPLEIRNNALWFLNVQQSNNH